MKRTILLIGALLLLLLLTQGVYAGASPDYRIDWSNSLTGSGSPASSPAYKVNITVGQTVNSAAVSPQYRVKMGYWAGLEGTYGIFLPAINKTP
jgi:hypothetical protein